MSDLIVFAAKYLFAVSIAGFLICWLVVSWRDKKLLLVRLLASAGVAYVLAWIASHFWYDPRPFIASHFVPLIAHANNNGFPSDHTLLTSLIACVVFTKSRWLGIILFCVALIVGYARVAAGVHHAADIWAACVISLLAVGFVLGIEGAIEQRLRAKRAARSASSEL